LPHLSGQELARRLRSLQPSLKVIFFSGLPADLRELRESAVFLDKPFSRDALAGKLKEALGRRLASFECEARAPRLSRRAGRCGRSW
jgi:FixJ family two-component response regulator